MQSLPAEPSDDAAVTSGAPIPRKSSRRNPIAVLGGGQQSGHAVPAGVASLSGAVPPRATSSRVKLAPASRLTTTRALQQKVVQAVIHAMPAASPAADAASSSLAVQEAIARRDAAAYNIEAEATNVEADMLRSGFSAASAAPQGPAAGQVARLDSEIVSRILSVSRCDCLLVAELKTVLGDHVHGISDTRLSGLREEAIRVS